MPRYVRSTSYADYNQHPSVGQTLKTYKGSPIKRSKYGVGKEIGGSIYVHSSYARDIVPIDELEYAEMQLQMLYPYFQYNCIRYDLKTKSISFQEAPDFDTAREPVVGDYITVFPDGTIKTGHSNYIFHHKWLWVKDDYNGFNVAESRNWSKKWLCTLQETSDGNGIDRWKAQLSRYNLS